MDEELASVIVSWSETNWLRRKLAWWIVVHSAYLRRIDVAAATGLAVGLLIASLGRFSPLGLITGGLAAFYTLALSVNFIIPQQRKPASASKA